MARTFAAGSSQKLSVASAVMSAAPLTMACWCRPSDAGGGSSKTIMSIDDGTTSNSFILRDVGTTAVVSALTGASGSFGISSTVGALTNSVWAHTAAVFASATSRTAYLNGTAAT